MNIIGVCGFAGSGKNAVVEALHEMHGGFCINLAFATVLKFRAALALGMFPHEVEADKHRLRPLLVELGRTGRMIDPEMWIRPVRGSVQLIRDGQMARPQLLTVSDARYLNECEWILREGGHVFYIDRPGIGPANDEERDSIAELRRVLRPPVIVNVEGAPEKAAAEILALVRKAA